VKKIKGVGSSLIEGRPFFATLPRMSRRVRENAGGMVLFFPVQSNEPFLTVARHVEQNALRANLVDRAQDWR